MTTGIDVINYNDFYGFNNFSRLSSRNHHEGRTIKYRKKVIGNIIESAYEGMESDKVDNNNEDVRESGKKDDITNDVSMDQDFNEQPEVDNNTITLEEEKTETSDVTIHRRRKSSKKLYKHRKHYSDYDITYLKIDNNKQDDSVLDTMDHGPKSHLNLGTSHARKRSESDLLSTHQFHTDFERRCSRSDSCLSDMPPPPTHIRKTSSHIDITNTKLYKEIYANNLRHYGYMLAKVSSFNVY